MLGIRFYRAVAVDLFAGDINSLAACARIVPGTSQGSSEPPIELSLPQAKLDQAPGISDIAELWRTLIPTMTERQIIHLLCPRLTRLPVDNEASLVLGALKVTLTENPSLPLERVTFVLPDLHEYYAYQEQLFRIFAE